MKKNPKVEGLGIPCLKKLLRIMRLITFLIFVTTLHVSASVYSQETKLTLNLNDVSIEQVLKQIEAQSEFKFLVQDERLDVNRKVNINVRKESVQSILKQLFGERGVDYVITDKNLIILNPAVKGKEQSAPAQPQQKKSIKGKVTDTSGGPLPGVTVVIKGTTTGTITDSDGNYVLSNVPQGSVLVFSFVGMASQSVTVGDKSEINVSMKESSVGLQEVVAVGYGTQKKETLTGSIATVKSSDVIKAPVTNVSNSLAGRAPGLVAVTGSGEPGYDGTTLRIRGSNTFNDNSVLVVVDGVPDRSLDRIDPNSIASITVLKDASAAIYGSRAANGVILVTTKRGKLGKPKLTFNADYGFNQPTKLPKMADAATYATLLNEVAYYNDNSLGMNSVYTTDQIQKFRDGSDPLHYPNTDWFKKVIKPMSAQSSNNVSLSGGSDAMRYFVSIGTKHQDGNYYNSATYYNQYDFRSNIDGQVTKDIKIGFDVAGRLEDKNFPIYSAYDIFRGLIQSYPTSVAVWPNGEPGPAIEGGRNSVVTSTDAAGYKRDKYYKLNTNLKLDINIPWVKGLTFSGNLSYDQGFDFTKTFSKPFNLYTWDGTSLDTNGNPVLNYKTYGGGYDNTPSLNEYFKSDYNKLAYGTLNYQTTIAEKHHLKLMVGSQISKGNTENFSAYRDLFLSTAIQELFAGGTTYQTTDGTGDANSRLSYFGRFNYSFANKYLIELIGRYDGSYIFPKNNRFGFFPSVSLGWVVSQENFWKDHLGFINYFKLRGSVGQTGNDRVNAYQYLTSYLMGYQYGKTYDSNTTYNIPFVTYSGSALTEMKTLYESVLANKNITWEVANQANIGFDARLLDDRLSVEADYFYYKRSNILWPQSANVPTSAGLSLPSVNYGKVSNQGVDGSISYRSKTRNQFSYSVTFNAGYAKNKVIQWGETAGVPKWQQTTGHPMGSGLYYLTDGIYHNQAEINADNLKYEIGSTPQPGDVKFVDYNHDGVINADDQVRIYKNNIPPFTFGTNINLNYKGFDMSALLQGATGGVAYIFSEAGQFGNYLQSFADARWTPDNPTANGPRTFNRGNWYWATLPNTYWLHKTNYVRLKSLQVGYTLPTRIVKRAGLQKLRVYLSGYNLLTYAPDMTNFDPEMGANTSANGAASSITGYNYPLERVVSMGLTVGF